MCGCVVIIDIYIYLYIPHMANMRDTRTETLKPY